MKTSASEPDLRENMGWKREEAKGNHTLYSLKQKVKVEG